MQSKTHNTPTKDISTSMKIVFFNLKKKALIINRTKPSNDFCIILYKLMSQIVQERASV